MASEWIVGKQVMIYLLVIVIPSLKLATSTDETLLMAEASGPLELHDARCDTAQLWAEVPRAVVSTLATVEMVPKVYEMVYYP